MIGLTGAQRVGKSTLAKAFAQAQDIPFLATDASGVYKALGMDPKREYSVEDRVAVHEVILQHFDRQYANAAKVSPLFIADRTPIDVICYMLADIQRSTLVGKPALANLVNDFVGRCYKSANRWFSVVVLLQPGIKPEEAEGKAPACPAFMEHYNMLAMGAMLDPRLGSAHFRIDRRVLELDQRVKSLTNAVGSAVESHQLRMNRAREFGDMNVH